MWGGPSSLPLQQAKASPSEVVDARCREVPYSYRYGWKVLEAVSHAISGTRLNETHTNKGFEQKLPSFTLLYFIKAYPANAITLGPYTLRVGVHVTKCYLSEGYIWTCAEAPARWTEGVPTVHFLRIQTCLMHPLVGRRGARRGVQVRLRLRDNQRSARSSCLRPHYVALAPRRRPRRRVAEPPRRRVAVEREAVARAPRAATTR